MKHSSADPSGTNVNLQIEVSLSLEVGQRNKEPLSLYGADGVSSHHCDLDFSGVAESGT